MAALVLSEILHDDLTHNGILQLGHYYYSLSLEVQSFSYLISARLATYLAYVHFCLFIFYDDFNFLYSLIYAKFYLFITVTSNNDLSIAFCAFLNKFPIEAVSAFHIHRSYL